MKLKANWVAALLLTLAALLVLLVGAMLVCPDRSCPVPAADAAGLSALNGWRASWIDKGFAATTWLGSLYILGPAALWQAWRDWVGGRRPAALFLPLALAGASMLARLAKHLVDRPRPDLFPALVAMPQDASFPSAHAMQITAFLLAWLLVARKPPTPGTVAVATATILVVALSRIHLQVHFPSDVAIGVAAAVLWVLALRCLPFWRTSNPASG